MEGALKSPSRQMTRVNQCTELRILCSASQRNKTPDPASVILLWGRGGAIELNTTNVPIRFNILRGDTVCVVWFLLVQVFACSSCFWGHNWRLCDRQEIMLSNQSSRSSSVISCLTELESGGAISFSLASSIFSSFGTSLTASQSEVWKKKTSVKALSPPPLVI